LQMTTGPGTNLIANQFCQVEDSLAGVPMNILNSVFSEFDFTDEGAGVLKWNGTNFDAFEFMLIGGIFRLDWLDSDGNPDPDATLLPGEGVLFTNAPDISIPIAFIGSLREQQVFQTQPGTNYLSATVPLSGSLTNVTGYVPHNGDTIQLWFTNTSSFSNYTFSSSTWSPTNPAVKAGQGYILITTNAENWTNTWHP